MGRGRWLGSRRCLVCVAASVMPGNYGGELESSKRSEIHGYPLLASALTMLHPALKVTCRSRTQSHPSVPGAHSSYKPPILFWKPVSPRKNKPGHKLLFIPQSPAQTLPFHEKPFMTI